MGILLGRIGFSLAFAIAGLYVLRAAIAVWRNNRRWKTEGVVVEGEIIAFKSESFSGDVARNSFEMPIVKFKIDNGAVMRFTSAHGERPNPYTIGQKIAVRYLPSDPNVAELDAVAGSWFTFIVLVFAGIVALGVATLPIILKPPHQ